MAVIWGGWGKKTGNGALALSQAGAPPKAAAHLVFWFSLLLQTP